MCEEALRHFFDLGGSVSYQEKKPATKPEIVNGEKWSPHVCCLQMSANENLMRHVQVSRPGAVQTSRLMDLDVEEVSI